MSATRSRIYECVRDNPGIHFNEIGRRLSIATGQTQHHLRVLQKERRLHREEVSGRTHYYSPAYSSRERRVIALLRRETTREVIVHLLKHERARPGEIADHLNVARSTVEWHLATLLEYDVATKDVVGDRGVERAVVSLVDRPETYRLLREVEPRRTDRLVDRFIRLADELLVD